MVRLGCLEQQLVQQLVPPARQLATLEALLREPLDHLAQQGEVMAAVLHSLLIITINLKQTQTYLVEYTFNTLLYHTCCCICRFDLFNDNQINIILKVPHVNDNCLSLWLFDVLLEKIIEVYFNHLFYLNHDVSYLMLLFNLPCSYWHHAPV